jgi:hypothetical protein
MVSEANGTDHAVPVNALAKGPLGNDFHALTYAMIFTALP